MSNNNWYVITGGPSTGKSTLLEDLEKHGYKTIPEAARVLIDQEIAKGKTIQEIRKDEQFFQGEVLQMKIDIEKTLNPEEVIFLDRGIPDSESYMLLHDFIIPENLKEVMKNCSYKKVFLLEPLNYESDYARTETEEERKKLQYLLNKAYEKLGFIVVAVPVLSREERASFVLNNL
jgi:predicted ATPase